jgi:hypothetical protein
LGANDVNVDPGFVDPNRSFWSWAVAQGSSATTISGKVSDGLTFLRLDPTLIRSSLIPYIQAGFAPTNAALANAGHDGVTIGAMEMASNTFDETASGGARPGGTAAVTLDSGEPEPEPVQIGETTSTVEVGIAVDPRVSSSTTSCLVCTVTTWVPGRTGSNYAVRQGQILNLLPGEAHYLVTNYPDVFRRG